ncbi:hypothetical protein HU200_021058 [Digitaria exilis]|uniref:FAD dependent oxidoreductase domain-containing protein n=1 Tax=Digitaria exilis TaxID=1010633 RepID=A0A835EZR4_9POAL|nr:hypothetical protein HU200_021058 [Digitaria exilis]
MAAAASTPAPPRRVIVCGGGVIGACTAYFLSTHGTTPTVPTVLEKCAPACAASGKSGGFLAADWRGYLPASWCGSTPSLSALMRVSFALHHRLASTLDGAAAYGFRPIHALSVHPGLFTKVVLAASGAVVVIGEVERVVVREDGRVAGVAVKGRAGVMEADAVVLALGPWSGRLEMIRELFVVYGQKAHSVTPHALFLRYQPEPGGRVFKPEVYPRPNGEVYMCGMSKDEEVPDDPAAIVGEAESIAMLHKIAGKLSGQLRVEEGAEVVAEQACYQPCTTDGLPVIGEMPGVKGCYVATGHDCWGILNAPATGAALAELILDGRAETVDLAPFSPERFLKRK